MDKLTPDNSNTFFKAFHDLSVKFKEALLTKSLEGGIPAKLRQVFSASATFSDSSKKSTSPRGSEETTFSASSNEPTLSTTSRLLAELSGPNPKKITPERLKLNTTLHDPRAKAELIKLYNNSYSKDDCSEGAFKDMFNAIDNAHTSESKTIVLGAWSLDWNNQFGQENLSLGERLIEAANKGVKVVLLSWNNKESGYEQFHSDIKKSLKSLPSDSLARQNIAYLPMSRSGNYVDRQVQTHHMKYQVIGDTLFTGGLDLTKDRDDGPSHKKREGQNWHDCHMQVRGEPVVDVLNTALAMAMSYKESDYAFGKKDNVRANLIAAIHASEAVVEKMTGHDDGSFMQVLLSLKKKYWAHPDEEHQWELNGNASKGIAENFIEAISKAEKHIWFESQYLVGRENEGKQQNELLDAIADRIIKAHKDGGSFHFDCILPFRPDGAIESTATQLYLKQQWDSIKYIMNKVDKATGTPGSSEKYLTIINPLYKAKAHQNNDRDMVYVHSKMMIADGERCIMGTANCNCRSMNGNKDSEIALDIQGPSYKKQITEYQHQLVQEMYGHEVVEALKNAQVLDELHTPKAREILNNALNNNLNDLEHCTSKKPQSTISTGNDVSASHEGERTFTATSWGAIPKADLYLTSTPPPHVKNNILMTNLVDQTANISPTLRGIVT